MSLPDYYKILQVPVNATATEIKAAYRRLAKLYHPDKNAIPEAEEKFKQIKEAYETLINTQRRLKYDAKRNKASTFTKTPEPRKKTPGKKTYQFTEEEARIRDFYRKEYQKKAGSQKRNATHQPNAQPNELKYILISVPVAVALLLLIIRIYEKPTPLNIPTENKTILHSEINTAESPFLATLGKNQYDTSSHFVMKLVNRSGYDGIAFFVNDSGNTVRHHFIANDFQLLAEQFPSGNYKLYYWLGKQFSYKYFLFDTILGNFKEDVLLDSSGPFCITPGSLDTNIVSFKPVGNPNKSVLKKIFSVRN